MREMDRGTKGQIIRLGLVILTAATLGVHSKFVVLEIRLVPPSPPGALRGERQKNAPGEAAHLHLCVGLLMHRRLEVNWSKRDFHQTDRSDANPPDRSA